MKKEIPASLLFNIPVIIALVILYDYVKIVLPIGKMVHYFHFDLRWLLKLEVHSHLGDLGLVFLLIVSITILHELTILTARRRRLRLSVSILSPILQFGGLYALTVVPHAERGSRAIPAGYVAMAIFVGAGIYFAAAGRSRTLLCNAAGCLSLIVPGLFILYALHYNIPERADQPPNVIFMLTDALRYDAAMQDGLFEDFKDPDESYTNCFSTSSWTIPSLFSIFTGLNPQDHGAGRSAFKPRRSVVPFPEILRNAGFSIACVQANELMMPWVSEVFPLVRYKPFGDAHYCTGRAEEILKGTNQPFFLYIHFMDTHMPYTQANRDCLPGKPMQSVIAPDILHFIQSHPDGRGEAVKVCVRGQYEAEAAFLSEEVNRFITFLKTRNLYERTIVILASDHGEEFWDHGYAEHGHQMFTELIHVPLFIHIPDAFHGAVPARNHGRRVSLLDIMPTLLENVGLKARNPLSGLSLLHPLPTTRPLLTESNHYGQEIQSLLVGNWHFIHYTHTFLKDFPYCGEDPNPFGRCEDDLFNLKDDPLELHSVRESFPAVGKRMSRHLGRLLSHHITRAEADEGVLSKEEKERLKSIGYIR